MTEIRDFMLGEECIEMGVIQLEKMRSPGVYVYLSEDSTAIYVGSSINMLWRSARADHGRAKARKACKSILFIPCKTLDDARALENKLISDLRPALNQRGGMALFSRALGVTIAHARAYKRLLE